MCFSRFGHLSKALIFPIDSLTAQYRKAVPLGSDSVSVIWKRPERKFKEFKYRVFLKWEEKNRHHCREVCYKMTSPNCTASVKNIPFPRTFYIVSWIVRDVTPGPVTGKIEEEWEFILCQESLSFAHLFNAKEWLYRNHLIFLLTCVDFVQNLGETKHVKQVLNGFHMLSLRIEYNCWPIFRKTGLNPVWLWRIVSRDVRILKGPVTLCNFLSNFSRNTIAWQVLGNCTV